MFLAPDFDWLGVLSFLLDLGEPQKQNLLFPFSQHTTFFIPFFASCPESGLRKQNGSTSLVRAVAEYSSCGALMESN